jgi:Prokaryotic membrane lipoprotein lipid attachment site
MRRILITLCAVALLTACAMTPQGQWRTSTGAATNPNDPTQQKDHVECLALARQGAQGHGAFFSDPALRAGLYDQATQQLYNQCISSRGYTWQRH